MLKRLLLKLASRGRPEALLRTIENLEEHCSGEACAWIISLDTDDPTVRGFDFTAGLMSRFPKLPMTFGWGLSESKIHAVNRDIPASDWDYVVALADDVRTTTKDFDMRIREDFEKFAPDLDGVLWYSDSSQNRIPTHPVIGRKYYDRFGYIWDPRFKSIYVDDVLRIVAKREGKLFKSASVAFVHDHYRFNRRKRDSTDTLNQRAINSDMHLFNTLRKTGFK